MKFALLDLLPFIVLGWAAIDRFGWLHGFGIVAAVYLLAPYYAVASIDVGKGTLK